MTDSAQLRRQLHIIRALDHPFTYPDFLQIQQTLTRHDLPLISKGTFERDLRDIRAHYHITITYHRQKRGYFLDFADDENIDDFRAFVRLLERRDRLTTLTATGPALTRYLQFEHHNEGAAVRFRGLDLLAPLYTALQRQLVVTFHYQPYTGLASSRRVEPGLLFEYRNRWYLDCFDLDKGQRTFGLDRITNLALTTEAINPLRQIDYRAARRHVIGVTAPPDALPQHVVLRFARPEAEYVRSLPLHTSQQIIAETDDRLTVSLSIICNQELIREILAYGRQVEVLEPAALREEIAGQIETLHRHYGASGKPLN